ncbi:hypothetical protein M514_01594 [Trichuris suis]|uniref:RING-type domain-containing protein n=1 Tax=Trichuris suis TaxID=68888 RepID=A0A085NAV1_9BILA|nr:hypothetical protein M513_01594 [Trichuris suis]KFD66597.1 hypothetical protein M514_01594 [Trichuris suis]KHJ49145.1 hypothetical protein D918_00263 [Trichuris suis]
MADNRVRQHWIPELLFLRDGVKRKDIILWVVPRLPLLFLLDSALNGSLLSLIVAAVSVKLPRFSFTKTLLSIDRDSTFVGLLDNISPERLLLCFFVYFSVSTMAVCSLLTTTRLLLMFYDGIRYLCSLTVAAYFISALPTFIEASGTMENLCQDWNLVFQCVLLWLICSHVATGPHLRIKLSVIVSCLASIAVCSILFNSALIAFAVPAVLQAFFSCLAILKCMKVLPLTFAQFRRTVFSWFRLSENGLDFYLTHSESIRVQLSLLLITFFVIRVSLLTVCGLCYANGFLYLDNRAGAASLMANDSHLVHFSTYVVYRYVLVRSCETFVALLGLCAFISVLSDMLISLMIRSIGESGRDDEFSGGFVMGAIFLMLCLQVDLTMQPPAVRIFLLYRSCMLIGIGVMHFVHSHLHNALMRLSRSGTLTWSLYVACYAEGVMFLLMPLLAARFIWLPEIRNPWFMSTVIYGAELFCKTLVSLLVHWTYLYRTYKKNVDEYVTEEIVFWVEGCGTTLQICFSILILLSGVWLLQYANDSITRGVLMALHAYVSIWLPTKVAVKNLSSYLAVKAQLNSLLNANVDQLRRLDDVCAICLCPFERHGKVAPCKHIFHAHCLRTWLRRRNVCPLCNREVFSAAMVTL